MTLRNGDTYRVVPGIVALVASARHVRADRPSSVTSSVERAVGCGARASSSIGRAADSKSAGCGFDSCPAHSPPQRPNRPRSTSPKLFATNACSYTLPIAAVMRALNVRIAVEAGLAPLLNRMGNRKFELVNPCTIDVVW